MDRKEYVQFQKTDNPDPINETGVLRLNGYQTFIKYFMSINTENDRILLIHSTGVGKTITSLSTSIEQMRGIGGNVFIIGFSKSVFKRELLTRPEFGYVSQAEANYLKNLKTDIVKFRKPADIQSLKEMKRKISSRMSANISFIGYKTLASHLFVKLSSKANLDSAESIDDIKFMLSKRWIKVNNEFMRKLNLAFVICDEIHNLYSTNALNSWGVALKYLMDNISCKVMLLSATPVNNRPEKIVNVLNLLSKDTYVPKDLFENGELSQKGIGIIKSVCRNKISFLIDRDISSFPEKEFVGTEYDFLKLVLCPASKLQEEHTLKVMLSNAVTDGIDEDSEDLRKITNMTPLEGKNRYLNDMFIPKSMAKDDDAYDGEELNIENIGQYSSKYFKMLTLIEEIVKERKGKIFIYHNYVSHTGTSLIKNILERNGIIRYGSYVMDSTRCANCFLKKIEHSGDCKFIPLTFMYATGMVNKTELDYNLDLFNSVENTEGDSIKIILGSQVVKESYDFKAVRNIIVAYMPDNISTLIQVLGRAIRKNSHKFTEHKLVKIFLLVTSLSSTESFEISKYKFKMRMFKEIKKINQIMAEEAIDKETNYNINYPPERKVDNMYDPLPVERRGIDFTKLNRLYANAYYINDEVSICQHIIKQFSVIKYPTPFTFTELKEYIRNVPFNFQRNTKLIEEESIIAALELMLVDKVDVEMSNSMDMFNESKRIPIKGNATYIKLLSQGMYVFVDTHNQKSISAYDFYRPSKKKTPHLLDVNKYVNSEYNQIAARDEFIEKIMSVDIEEIDFIDAEHEVHLNTIIYVIEYFNDMWLRGWEMSKYHDALVKLLFFYNKFKIIIFANTMDKETAADYSRYNITATGKNMYTSSASHYADYPSLMNSMQTIEEIKEEYIVKFHNYHTNKDKFFPSTKVKDSMLPIGHFFTKDIGILDSSRRWITNNNFNKLSSLKKVFIDNKKIVGFLEKDKAGLAINFKIKLSNNGVVHSDSRKNTVGSICETFDKSKLIEVCKMLGIDPGEFPRKGNLCESIKMKLIDMELNARSQDSKIRYFKFYWE